MNLSYQIKRWDITHPVWLAILRVILGACLTIRGIYFLDNSLLLQNVIEKSDLNILNINMSLTVFITWVHILGGTFIILGLLTPIAIWAQIPIVLGAIVFINAKHALFTTHSDLVFSFLILALLILFVFEGGGGKISMDSYLKKYLL